MNYNQFNQFQPYQQRSNLDWIMVPTVQDVDKVTVQPGAKAWVMVQNEPVFALRTADNMGLIQTDIYTFQKYEPKPTAEPASDYVTKSEFETALNDLRTMIGGIMHESTDK